jgi:hypothetical protein
MDAYDHNLIARILLTLMTCGYAVVTVLADFNKTHATNPMWTPHARFHVVWQISSYVGFGVLALALIWLPGPYYIARLYFACLLGAIIYGAFFVAVFSMRLYGGRAFDDNGYLPFPAPVPLIARKWDVNITAFSLLGILLLAGVLSISDVTAG